MLRSSTSRRRIRASMLLTIGCIGAQASQDVTAQAVASGAGASDTRRDRGLEEVIVTSRKVVESLQHVPISVVAISGEDLELRSIENLADAAQTTPNVMFAESPQSGRVGGSVFIRGIGQRDPISAYDPSVGIYIDGVYMGRMYANNFDMLEIQRVEVLRGPQGTLFGKNTSGGAVSIVTKQPDTSALSGRVQLTGGDRSRFDVLASVNVPLIENTLAVSLAGSQLTEDGYGKRIDGQEMANTDRRFGRAQVLFTPGEKFSVLLGSDWTEFDEKNGSYKLVDTNPTIASLAALNSATTSRYDDRWLSNRDYFYNATGPNLAKGTLRGTSLTLKYDADWATLTSISAYRDLEIRNELDPDGSPVQVLNKFEHVDQDQVSQEFQAAGTALSDRLSWVAGLYYFHEDIDQFEGYDLLTPLFGDARDFSRRSPIENDSVALFGQSTYGLTEKLRLTAGLRYTQDEKTIQSTQYNAQTGGSVVFATPTNTYKSDSVSPRLGLDYQWTDDVMTYVSVAQGAKNGGYNGRSGRLSDFRKFDDEVVWTYEIGVRSDLFDGVARLNATAFYSDYSDLQLQISGSTVVNGAPAPFAVIENIPEAQILGGELELMVMPVAGFVLSGSLGLTDGEYKKLPTNAEFVAARMITTDSKFSHTPEVSYTLGAEYSAMLLAGLDITARADYLYKGKTYFNPENTANLVQPGYGLLNARLTFEHESGVSASVFGTNLTDQTYIVGGFDDAANPNPGLGFSIVSQGMPRTVGVSVQVRF